MGIVAQKIVYFKEENKVHYILKTTKLNNLLFRYMLVILFMDKVCLRNPSGLIRYLNVVGLLVIEASVAIVISDEEGG